MDKQAQAEKPIDLTIHGEGQEDGHYVRHERFLEAITKKDAALKAFVEAAKRLMARLDPHDYPDEQSELNAAITQAQEALK